MKKKKSFDIPASALVCQNCGKPLVTTSEHGMFCEDKCGFEESKRAMEQTKDFIKKLCEGHGKS